MREEADAPFLIGQPARLTSDQHFSRRASLRVYHQSVDQSVAIHLHEFYEMYVILGGEGTHVLNGTVHPLARGSFAPLTPADFHAVDSRPGALSEEVLRQ